MRRRRLGVRHAQRRRGNGLRVMPRLWCECGKGKGGQGQSLPFIHPVHHQVVDIHLKQAPRRIVQPVKQTHK